MPLIPKQEPPYYEIEDGPAPAGTKYYIALWNQAATDPPVETILVNTIGTHTITRESEGAYRINSTAAFPEGKTVYWASNNGGGNQLTIYRNGDGIVELFQQQMSDNAPIDGLTELSIEIRVYP